MNQLEAIVANVNDLQDGEMRQVSVGETDVLLTRLAGEFYAVGAYCSHYQAPLAEGVLSRDHVVCPWHGACFSLVTGDQREPPGLDSLPRYPARVEGETVVVSVPAAQRVQSMAQYSREDDGRTFVILGAGAAGAHAAETLRQAGYQGRILMVTREPNLPYDRTWLSKDYLIGQVSREQLPLRSADFYKDHAIEVLLNKEAVRVDAIAKTITFQAGDPLKYDALLLATGGKPRQLDVPGKDLENVFTLRSFQDTERLLEAAKRSSRALVIGSSFIGMEVAAGLTQQGLDVTVVSPDSTPFEQILGQEIGQVFQQVHQEKGVCFRLGSKVSRFEGHGKVETVILDNHERLAADLVVVGVGVQPATEFLEGVALHPKDQSVPVDQYLRAAEGLYAAGDIASYPNWRTGLATRVEHWRVAAQQGRIAAYNMAGQATQFKGVPIFWTMQFQFPLRYVGHAEEWDEIIFDGDLQKREFIAFYVKDNQVLAVASSQRDTETAAISELMRLNQMPTAERLRKGSVDLVGQLRSQ